jgi:hypothetical protein
MHVTITFKDGSILILEAVKTVTLISAGVIETATFGNESVQHRFVSSVCGSFNFKEV